MYSYYITCSHVICLYLWVLCSIYVYVYCCRKISQVMSIIGSIVIPIWHIGAEIFIFMPRGDHLKYFLNEILIIELIGKFENSRQLAI